MPADLRLSNIVTDTDLPDPGGTVNAMWGIHNYGDAANEGHENCLVTLVGPDASELHREDVWLPVIEPGHHHEIHKSLVMGQSLGEYELTVHCSGGTAFPTFQGARVTLTVTQ